MQYTEQFFDHTFEKTLLSLQGKYINQNIMVVERTNSEVIIRLPVFMNIEAIQRTIDLISLKEATAHSIATQEDINKLSKEANKGWWAKNRSRYIQ